MSRKMPCGQLGCIAAYRIAWAMDDWTIKQAADAIGRGKTSLIMVAENHGMPPRARSRPTARFSANIVRAAWSDQHRSLDEIARDLNTSAKSLSSRARGQYGLPSRKKRRKQVQPCRWFSEMWAYGVGSVSMADHIGCNMSTVTLIAKRLGLPLRPAEGRHCRKPSVADFMRDELPRLLLARAAAIDTVAAVARGLEPGGKIQPRHVQTVREYIKSRNLPLEIRDFALCAKPDMAVSAHQAGGLT